MKKTILAAALGIVASVAPSYGQGSIFFNNYGTSTDAKVTISDPGSPLDGQPAANGFHASLLYQFGGGPLTPLPGSAAFNPATPGYFQGPIVTIPGYSGGPISFVIQAWDGTGFGSPTSRFIGQSALFTLDSIATGTQPVGEFGPAFQPFQVSCACPEPGTVALVGLGLVSLLIFRRQRL